MSVFNHLKSRGKEKHIPTRVHISFSISQVLYLLQVKVSTVTPRFINTCRGHQVGSVPPSVLILQWLKYFLDEKKERWKKKTNAQVTWINSQNTFSYCRIALSRWWCLCMFEVSSAIACCQHSPEALHHYIHNSTLTLESRHMCTSCFCDCWLLV